MLSCENGTTRQKSKNAQVVFIVSLPSVVRNKHDLFFYMYLTTAMGLLDHIEYFTAWLADEKGYSKVAEESGAKFACDTCHVVAPLKGRFKALATNSAKGIYYGRGKNGFKTVFRPLAECVKLAVEE